MKVQDIMIREVVQSSPGNSISEAARVMREKAVGCLVITVDGGIKGIITDRDLLGCLEQGHDPRECKISVHMSRPVVVLKPEEDYLTAADVMHRKRIRRLPIATAGKLLGIVSLSDLTALAAAELERFESSTRYVASLISTPGTQAGVRFKAGSSTTDSHTSNQAFLS